MASVSWGQYKQPDLTGFDANAYTQQKKKAVLVMSGRENDRQAVDSFLRNWFFKPFAHNRYRTRLTAMREEAMQFLDPRRTRDPAMHDFVLSIVYDECSKLINDNYAPPVRVNACLMMGDLNQREMVPGRELTPPVPHPLSRSYLINTYASPNQIEPVRLAALMGLARHAKYSQSLDDQSKGQLAQLAVSIVRQTERPAERSVNAHAWIRMRGVEMIGDLGLADSNGQFATLLLEIVGAEDEPLMLRCAAVESLGKLEPLQGDATAMADSMLRLAVTCCEAELEKINERLGQARQGGGFGNSGPLTDEAIVPYRRRLAHRLDCIHNGLAGPSDQLRSSIWRYAESSNQLQRVQQVANQIDSMFNMLVDTTIPPGSFLETVTMETGKLREMAGLTADPNRATPAGPPDNNPFG